MRRRLDEDHGNDNERPRRRNGGCDDGYHDGHVILMRRRKRGRRRRKTNRIRSGGLLGVRDREGMNEGMRSLAFGFIVLVVSGCLLCWKNGPTTSAGTQPLIKVYATQAARRKTRPRSFGATVDVGFLALHRQLSPLSSRKSLLQEVFHDQK